MSVTYFIDAKIDDAYTLDHLVQTILDNKLSLLKKASLDDYDSGEVMNAFNAESVMKLIVTAADNGSVGLVLHEFTDSISGQGHSKAVGKFLRDADLGYRIIMIDQEEVERQNRWMPGMLYEVTGIMSNDEKLLVEMDEINRRVEEGGFAFEKFKTYHRQVEDQTFDLSLSDEVRAHIAARLGTPAPKV